MSATARVEKRALWEIRALARLSTDGLLSEHLQPRDALAVIHSLAEEALPTARGWRPAARVAIRKAIEAVDEIRPLPGAEGCSQETVDNLKAALLEAREAVE